MNMTVNTYLTEKKSTLPVFNLSPVAASGLNTKKQFCIIFDCYPSKEEVFDSLYAQLRKLILNADENNDGSLNSKEQSALFKICPHMMTVSTFLSNLGFSMDADDLLQDAFDAITDNPYEVKAMKSGGYMAICNWE